MILPAVPSTGASCETWFLDWCCTNLQAHGKTAWLLIWDTASWYGTKHVHTCIRERNVQVKALDEGVRILPLFLPLQSPWRWSHRAEMDPWATFPDRTNGLLTARQLAERMWPTFHCSHEAHRTIPEKTS